MPRANKEQVIRNHQIIEEVSSRLFREQGFNGVTVSDLMSAAGLTHGGFYRHFDSKDALASIACQKAFADSSARIAGRVAKETNPQKALRAVIHGYLSVERRDNLADGCAASAFASDISREPAGSPLRDAYIDGVKGLVGQLAALSSEKLEQDRSEEAIVQLSAMVGALLLSRATKGDGLSEKFLQIVRARLVRST